MPLAFGPNIVEGKVYRSRRKQDDDDEKQAIKELQAILACKNRRSCDCEAQVHELLENCLACGRLTCTLEGSGKCFSCGNIVLNEDQRDRIRKHVDLLPPSLVVDRTNNQASGSRSTIIDNQFDHFSIDNKKHLREEDRRKLKANLEELQAKRYQRKLLLEVDIDQLQAGSRSVPQVDDFEDELKKLQLNQHNTGSSTNYTLAELIQRESKLNYNLDYIEPYESNKKPSHDTTRGNTDKPHKNGVVINIGNNIQKQKQRLLKNQKQASTSKKYDNKKPNKQSAWNNNSNKDTRNQL